MNLLFGDFIFGDLRNWSILTGIGAGLLCVVALIFLLVGLLRRRRAWLQNIAFLLGLTVGAWSLFVAYSAYQQWVAMVQQTSPHAYAVTSIAFADAYRAGIARCQTQCLLVLIAIVLLLLITGWSAWSSSRLKTASQPA